MSLTKTLEEIKKVIPLATENVEGGAYETLNARRGRKNQSIERLKQLKSEYREKLRQTVAYILVVGSDRDTFTTNAVEQHKCFSEDPDTFYKDLSNRLTKHADPKRENSSSLMDILGRHLEEKAGELDISSYNQLIFGQKYRRTIGNNDELLSWIKEVINDQVGSEIVGIQTLQSVTGKAIDADHAARVTPIILPASDEKFALDVINGLSKVSSRVFLVGAGKVSKALKQQEGIILVKESNNETVEQALKTISDSLKR